MFTSPLTIWNQSLRIWGRRTVSSLGIAIALGLGAVACTMPPEDPAPAPSAGEAPTEDPATPPPAEQPAPEPPASETPTADEDLLTADFDPVDPASLLRLPEASLIGDDPIAIAEDILALPPEETAEGGYNQSFDIIASDDSQTWVLATEEDLMGDSVRSVRYRLRFVPTADDQWELVEAGRQQICWPGRGQQDWSTDLCT
jgi:hypothetical protein